MKNEKNPVNLRPNFEYEIQSYIVEIKWGIADG